MLSKPAQHLANNITSPFWYGTASGTYSYDNSFSEAIRTSQVRIHRADISHLSHHAVHLDSDPAAQSIATPTDLLITATGFTVRPTFTTNPPTLAADLGLPVPTSTLSQSQLQLWQHHDTISDAHLSTLFPRLTSGPYTSARSTKVQPYNPGLATPNSDLNYTPYRLHRSIAPPNLDKSIVFLGYVSNVANTLRLEVQCLWAYAYLTGNIDSLATTTQSETEVQEQVYRETSLGSRYARHRSPYGHGKWYLDLNFDQLVYIDLLMADLGFECTRKVAKYRRKWEAFGNKLMPPWLAWCLWCCWLPNILDWAHVWLREWIGPYGQEEYRGLVEEWLTLRDWAESRDGRVREGRRIVGKTNS